MPCKDDDDDEPNLLAADIKPLKIEHGWVLISHLNLDLDGDFDAQEFEPNRPKLRSFEEKNRNSVESMIIWQKELSRILDSNLSVSIFDQKEVLWHQREHIWPNDCWHPWGLLFDVGKQPNLS